MDTGNERKSQTEGKSVGIKKLNLLPVSVPRSGNQRGLPNPYEMSVVCI